MGNKKTAAAVFEKKERFFEPPKRNAHCVRRQKACAHIVRIFSPFCVLFGADAQRLWRFGGSIRTLRFTIRKLSNNLRIHASMLIPLSFCR
jgi:hypothetical protein